MFVEAAAGAQCSLVLLHIEGTRSTPTNTFWLFICQKIFNAQLMSSQLINLCSVHIYDSLKDKRHLLIARWEGMKFDSSLLAS